VKTNLKLRSQVFEFSAKIKAYGLDTKLYKKIKEIAYPQLKQNPFFGNNIKKLKSEFEGIYRFGNYRIFYRIEKEKLLSLFWILNIAKRLMIKTKIWHAP